MHFNCTVHWVNLLILLTCDFVGEYDVCQILPSVAYSSVIIRARIRLPSQKTRMLGQFYGENGVGEKT